MDKLRRHRGALRGSTTRLLSEASEILLQDTLPSSVDLEERIDGLRDKDTALTELDKQIADALDGEEFDAEIVGALDYYERIVKAISGLRSAINARAPVGSTINETNQPRHAGTSDGSSNSSMGAARSDTTEYAVVLHRVLMRSLPEELAIQYRKRMKTDIDAADSVVFKLKSKVERAVERHARKRLQGDRQHLKTRHACSPGRAISRGKAPTSFQQEQLLQVREARAHWSQLPNRSLA
ncbi:hypothetical protein MTO96_036219 [Rhipicephalus appendiculatus]